MLSNVLDYGIGRGLETNPLPAAARMWNQPTTTEGAVDPRVVVNRRQAEALLTAVSYQGRIGPRLVGFFACLYYAGLRPSETVELREDANLDLPAGGGVGNSVPAWVGPHGRVWLVTVRPTTRSPRAQTPRSRHGTPGPLPPGADTLPANPPGRVRHRHRRQAVSRRPWRRSLREPLWPCVAGRTTACPHPRSCCFSTRTTPV